MPLHAGRRRPHQPRHAGAIPALGGLMLATVTGTMLVPGVSKNGRLYTPQLIEKAVTRMQARIADGDARRIVMRTHHGAGDDTTQIVGHLTGVTMDSEGHAKYEAVLNDTTAAKEILA